MTLLKKYAHIEDPQALIEFDEYPTLVQGNETWVRFSSDFTIVYQSPDSIGQAISASAGALLLPKGVWKVTVNFTYTGVMEGTEQAFTIDLDVDEPSPQAIAEGGRYTNTSPPSAPVLAPRTTSFCRVLHVDVADTPYYFYMYADFDGVEGPGSINILKASIEVRYIGAIELSLPLASKWNINASDTLNTSLVETDTGYGIDTDNLTTWVHRAGGGDWVVDANFTDPTFSAAGFTASAGGGLPGISFAGTTGLTMDSQASSLNGDPDFVYIEQFYAATPSSVNVLLSFADSSDHRVLIQELSSQYQVYREGSGGVSSATGGTVTAGSHWIAVSRDSTLSEITVWVDSTTPIINASFLGGGTINPTLLTLGAYHGSITASNSTRICRRSYLGVNTTLTNAEVAQLAAYFARWE